MELSEGTIMCGKYENDDTTFNETVPACRLSKDGGVTWSGDQPLDCEMGIHFMTRLQSGALVAVGKKES